MLQITAYEQTDIPPGMTCEQYRQLKLAAGPPRRRRRLPTLRSLLRW
jgi:hypothetical protein